MPVSGGEVQAIDRLRESTEASSATMERLTDRSRVLTERLWWATAVIGAFTVVQIILTVVQLRGRS